MTVYDSGNIYPPVADSADNNYIRDVIGNKNDSHSGDSLMSGVETLKDHVHSVSRVYPTLSTGITVTADAAVWTLGALVEVVPASTITDDFDLHSIDVENLSANDVYELVMYQGAGDVEIGRVRVIQDAVQSATLNTPILTPIIPANARIRAAVASAAGSSSLRFSVRYHTY